MIVNSPKLIFASNYTINSLVFLRVGKIDYIYITIYRIENNEPELYYFLSRLIILITSRYHF